LGSMLFKKKGEFLKVLNHILNRGANNCGGHCIYSFLLFGFPPQMV